MKTAATCNLLNAYHLTQKAIKTRVNYNIKYESWYYPYHGSNWQPKRIFIKANDKLLPSCN